MPMPDYFQWNESQHQLLFLGHPATLFLQDPSLSSILRPLKEELGEAYFFLLVAYSASQKTDEDYFKLVKQAGVDFKSGLERWADGVAIAGWGQQTVLEIDEQQKVASIRVENPWELAIFPESHTAFALPFLCGKLSGLFSHHFACTMRARVSQIFDEKNGVTCADIKLERSDLTLRSELQHLAQQEGFTRHEKLQFLNKQLQQKTLELENSNRRLEELASQDGLTELVNRRHFMELAEREFHVCRRYQYPSSLMMFDIDFFKDINDQYGHLAGDKVLCAIAKTCHGLLRKTDICARFGGEEFVILLPHTPLEHGVQIAERLKDCIGALKVPYNDDLMQVTVSIGVGAIGLDDVVLDDAIKRVDDALYEAKHAGRNQIVCAY